MNTITPNELRKRPAQTVEMLCESGVPCPAAEQVERRNPVIPSRPTYDMPQADQSEMTVREAGSRFADRWVLMRVTALDRHGNPDRGIVVRHSGEREALTGPVMRMHRQDPQARSYIFFTGDVMPENAVVML